MTTKKRDALMKASLFLLNKAFAYLTAPLMVI